MKCKPSDLFIGAILRAYDKEKTSGKQVTPSALWDHICAEAMGMPYGFVQMFAWDTGQAKRVNRIGTIMETIKAGLVPNLMMSTDAKGRPVVEELPF